MRKRITCLLLALTLFACVLTPIAAAERGDPDNDGKITSSDARLALRAAVGLEHFEKGSEAFAAADANQDGEITAEDARTILRTAVGLQDLDGNPVAKLTEDEIFDLFQRATAVHNKWMSPFGSGEGRLDTTVSVPIDGTFAYYPVVGCSYSTPEQIMTLFEPYFEREAYEAEIREKYKVINGRLYVKAVIAGDGGFGSTSIVILSQNGETCVFEARLVFVGDPPSKYSAKTYTLRLNGGRWLFAAPFQYYFYDVRR